MVEPGFEPRQLSSRACVLRPAFTLSKERKGSHSQVCCAAVVLLEWNKITFVLRKSQDLISSGRLLSPVSQQLCSSHILLSLPSPGPRLPPSLCTCYSIHSAVLPSPCSSRTISPLGVGAVPDPSQPLGPNPPLFLS